MSITIKDLLLEKYNNFITFIKDKIPDEQKPKFDLYKNLPVEVIINFIRYQIYPFKDDIGLIIIRIASDNQVSIENLSSDDKTKIGKYIQFFCDILIRIDKN